MQLESQIVQVNIDDIIPNRFQPRISFDEKALNELAASIKEHGIIQPLVLRKLGKKYEIIAGERRYKAATLAGLATVPAVISNIDDNKSAEVALVENIQRKDLTPIEEARSYKNLLDKGYLTQEQLAKKMGLSQSAVSNKLRLLSLDNKVQQAILDNKISERHARSLLKLTNPEDQRKWLDKIIKERLTVKKLDELLKNEVGSTNEEISDVPLVNTPNIEQIKEQATDINNSMFNDSTSTQVSEGIMTDSNTMINQNIENNINNAVTQPMDETISAGNKFFNPLEESPATLENLNPFAQDANFTVDQNSPSDSEVEIFDMPGNENPTPEVNQEPISMDGMNQEVNDMPAMNLNIPSTMNELNPNNEFCLPIQEQSVSNPAMDIDVNPTTVNPMDNVDSLVNTSNAPVQSDDDMSLGDVITGIRSMVEDLNAKGFNISIDEADLEMSYQMNISIMK